MALHLVIYGIISALLIHSSLVHSLNGQVSPFNSSVQQVNYVTPNRSMPCLTDQHPCLTIDEYASQIDKFFLNDSIFSFGPGNHSLNIGLHISGINNVSFVGLSNNRVTITVLNMSACISWEDCENVEITNINFIIDSNFSCVLSFNSTFYVNLSNIAILGNGHIGCSSIISEKSVVDISNSTFTGMSGSYGAALIASRSNVSFSGNNSFLRNKALSGGAMFLYNSAVLFNGTNSFYENCASYVTSYIEPTVVNECFSSEYSVVPTQLTDSSGGAITSYSSTIVILDYSSETSGFSFSTFSRWYPMNDSNYEHSECQMMPMYRGKSNICQNSDYYCIREKKLPCLCSNLSIKNCTPTLKFYHNFAVSDGGSIYSLNSSIKAVGTMEYVGNFAERGGALHLRRTCFYFIGSPCLTCYLQLDNSLQFSSHILFLNNSARLSGGALYITDTNFTFYGSVSFVNNSASYGGALEVIVASFCFIGSPCLLCYVQLENYLPMSSHMLFLNNSARLWGGALFIAFSNYTFHGSVSFVNNSADEGGALYIQNSRISLNVDRYSSKKFTGVHIIFSNNLAQFSGGAIFLADSSNAQVFGSVSLIRNYANYSSGAIYLEDSNLQMCGSVSLIENNATIRGGAIVLYDSTIQMFGNVSLLSNNATIGGAISVSDSTMQMFGNLSLVSNNATTKGGAIFLYRSIMQMCGTLNFVKNNANIGGAVHTDTSNISMGVNCSDVLFTMVVFQLNTATYSGGSISSIDSHLYFTGSALFVGNTAGYGGAMILDGTSNMTLMPNLSLSFINNRANQRGGVFYYDHSVSSCDSFEQYYKENPECFVSFEGISPELKNNFTSKAGSFLYSGKLGICYRYSGKFSILEGCRETIGENYCSDLKESSLTSAIATEELFSADIEDVKFCQMQHNFSSRNVTLEVYPGEKFNVSLIGAGTFDLPVSTRILHKMLFPIDEKIELRRVELLTKVSSLCSNVSYYLLVHSMTNPLTVHIKLYHQNPCDSLVDGVNLFIDIKPCPIGFELSHEHQKCTCDKWLQKFDINECNIDNLSIERKINTFWVSKLANYTRLIFHNGHCPFDFCKDNIVNVSLSNPSVQCAFDRSGTLCGQCREHYSLALGTLHCLQCANNSYITLVLPFALAGMALVIVILLLHLSVDVGTLNGLIFYANVVHSNREAYFQHTREITNFHAIFISWLNLDFGIETCFYHGMDIYTYSWLQFVFPFYLWFLIGAIIFICRYSQRLSNSLGRNPVAALATVLFLSYGKVLNTIIAPLSKTELMFKSNDGYFSTRSVWLYDGSVEYFTEPKHVALGLFAILILLLAFVPYTFILLCGHWLIAYSDMCLLSWLNKIKPILDVHYAPFKQKTRYWIGLTLLTRLALLLTIAINAVSSDSVNILVIASVTAGLLCIKGRVYVHKYNDILESSFILNLCVLSVATLYLKDKNIESQIALLSASVGISFVIFIGILLFHIYLLFKSINILKYVANTSLLRKNWLLHKTFTIVPKENENVALKSNDPKVVTSTLVELHEPLIDSNKV